MGAESTFLILFSDCLPRFWRDCLWFLGQFDELVDASVELGDGFVLSFDDVAEVAVGGGKNLGVGCYVVAADGVVVAGDVVGDVFVPVEEFVDGAVEEVGDALDGLCLWVGIVFCVDKRGVSGTSGIDVCNKVFCFDAFGFCHADDFFSVVCHYLTVFC